MSIYLFYRKNLLTRSLVKTLRTSETPPRTQNILPKYPGLYHVRRHYIQSPPLVGLGALQKFPSSGTILLPQRRRLSSLGVFFYYQGIELVC